MKNIVFLFLFCFCVSVTAQNNEWVKVKDTASAYIIKFPLKPKKGSQNVPTANGDVEMITYTVSSDNTDSFLYMTSFSQYPSSFFPNGLDTFEKRSKVLDGSVNGAVTNVKGRLISDAKMIFNGYDGRNIKIEVNFQSLPYIIHMKMILVGFKLYMIQTISAKEKDGNADEQRFFDSFELINVKQ